MSTVDDLPKQSNEASNLEREEGDAKDKSGSLDPFDGLLDDLLVEILCRLGCSKYADRCKSVSKRWHLVISHSYFVRHFVAHKISTTGRNLMVEELHDHMDNYDDVSHYADESDITSNIPCGKRRKVELEVEKELLQVKDRLPFALVYSPKSKRWGEEEVQNGVLMYVDEELLGRPSGFSVTYPPWSKPDRPVFMEVYGASHDLLLCCRNAFQARDFCVYNIWTKQWVQLPDPSLPRMPLSMGFVCDPYYSIDKKNRVVICNNAGRFFAAWFGLLTKFQSPNQTQLRLELFSSETWRWKSLLLSSPKPFSYNTSFYSVFVYGRRLHVYSISGILWFDPRDGGGSEGVIHGRLIDWPAERVPGHPRNNWERFGVSQGCLLFAGLYKKRLSIWELMDHDKGSWCLTTYKFCFEDLFSKNSHVFQFTDFIWEGVRLLGFHPSWKHLIYFNLKGNVFMCNLKTSRLKLVASELSPRICAKQFWLVRPWWPTPIKRAATNTSFPL